MRKTKNASGESYSKNHSPHIRCLAVCFSIIALASCGKKADDSMFQTCESAVNAYGTYLSEMRKVEKLSTDRLIEEINRWQTLRDSVFMRVANDTVGHPHADQESTLHILHDSLQTEFIRLAQSTPKTFKDVLLVKEQTSRYRHDMELVQAVADTKPFFRSLDSIPPYQKTAKNLLSVYRSFLVQTQETGINGKEDLLAFIKEEDRLFRSFLDHLPELSAADLSAITHGTEKCCLAVFQAAEGGKLSYRDALVYIAGRTNRRMVLNTSACMDDVGQGKAKTGSQACAYVRMLLQPYVTLDSFSVAVLSDTEMKALHDAAERMPSVMAVLNTVIGTDNSQWQALPELLAKIMITSI